MYGTSGCVYGFDILGTAVLWLTLECFYVCAVAMPPLMVPSCFRKSLTITQFGYGPGANRSNGGSSNASIDLP